MSHEDSVAITAQMLVRKPVSDVFEAVVNPQITTKFWFTKSTGRLFKGSQVRWDWEMFGVGDDLTVKEFEEDSRILIEWKNDPTFVEWRFEDHGGGATLVTISNWGFPGACAEVLPSAVEAMGGYTIVLAGLKAWLEHGIQLNLVPDQFPNDGPG